MTKTIQNISECRKFIRKVNEQVRKANEAEEYTYADAKREGKIKIDKDGSINCSKLGLTSLEGAPEKVKGDFICSSNQLTSLKGAPKEVGGDFICGSNQLTSLKGAPKEVEGEFNCSFNYLTSLKGAPKEVGTDFYCSHNQLTSLEGAPQKVSGDFYCWDNQLTSLEGAPQKVGGNFSCLDNKKITKADIAELKKNSIIEGDIYYIINNTKTNKTKNKNTTKTNKTKNKNTAKFSTLDDIQNYMESNNLEEYDLTYNDVEFTFYLEDDELTFSFSGPIWSSDIGEIPDNLLEDGDLEEISDYIIEEGEGFTRSQYLQDGGYYNHPEYGLLQYDKGSDEFFSIYDSEYYNGDDIDYKDLEYIEDPEEDDRFADSFEDDEE